MAEPIPSTSVLLPRDAREELIAAAQIKNPRERAVAVQQAVERAQRHYPQFFNLEEGAAE